ncbi:nucleotidyltransferase family protein [Heyndrickxia vini]|uniref:Nucleotidyltransferase family protein n=1 Tax=Heyndrickxia vini TaxID=1476025 RepID=A0ABX7E2L8_9BACI|nr:nucleotidyltransferase family protein [Heyndrickxia vini]QQZ09963.1 nucleotidyltransferase family protein [Heyndrickxia vini]
MVKNESDIIRIIQEDAWMMDILHAAKTLELPDWWVCAGFVRSKIWDTLHGFSERTPMADVDVIYFDPSNADERVEKVLEVRLRGILPNVPWSVKNEVRMHLVNNIPPYTSSVDAISKFPETATSLGVKLNEHDEAILTAPNGIEDVLAMVVKPTPYFSENEKRKKVFETRVRKKNWGAVWNKVNLSQLCGGKK